MGKMPLILIVEDSPTQARQVASNLSKHGIRTVVAGDGPEGLRAVDEHKPDLIVLDINLPTMDGYQVCRRLKRDPNTAAIPVIMLTEFEGSGATIRGLDAGADDYIPKDVFAVENLMTTLQAFGLIESSA
jgi:CheY-like chemotaxis protein